MLRVLSLFDGMAGARVALDNLGIPNEEILYCASEIDKYAIEIAKKNYPDIVELGDISKWETWGFKRYEIDLVIAGSPCQGFSHAGKGLNFDDPRSKLFFTFVDILHYLRPRIFVLENVRMKKEWRDIISNMLGVEPVLINSALVTAQNRERYYWSNLEIKQPEDRGICLKDIILEDGIPVLLHNIYGGFKEKQPRIFDKKSPTLRTPAGGGHIPSVIVDRDKSYALDSSYYKGTSWQIYFERKRRQAVFMYDGKEVKIRKLHPVECERLQGVPDNYTEGVSNTQRYKMIGNGFTVPVIEHILKPLTFDDLDRRVQSATRVTLDNIDV